MAFIEFTKHFDKQGLKVPQIFAEDTTANIYLIEDLGDTTLFAFLTEEKKTGEYSQDLSSMYHKVLKVLPNFQINGGKGLNYSLCYPRSNFDKQSMIGI